MSSKPDTAPIVFKFTPAKPGDFLQGIPKRDLTASDVARLSPLQLYNATVSGPSGKPMYTAVPAPKPEKGGDAK